MRDSFAGKSTTAEKALARIRSGQHVVVGSGGAEPLALVEALAARGPQLYDVEVLHLLTLGPAPYADARFAGHLRHNAFFIGPNVRGAVRQGWADYTPCYLHEVPGMIRSGRIPVDALLIQVSPPERGSCSLGIAVDVLKAAADAASCVIAQVNPRMPRTQGDTLIPVSKIDAFVESDLPLFELRASESTPEATQIGRYVAQLVEDGSTLQAGIGAIPDAVLAALAGKKNLGVHSEMVSDGVLSLIKSGAINGRKKSLHPGKVVVSFVLGSRRLYESVGKGSPFEFYPCDYVNDPFVIAKNEKMVSINSALAVDLTGQVAADSVDHRFYSGVGGQVDFIRGAARSPGGKSVIALPSTAKDGTVSRIACCLAEGTGIVTTRADVDFVVTEYGIANLKGRTIRERALSLIQIAHPSFRAALAAQAQEKGYIDAGRVLPPARGRYPVELETKRSFRGAEVSFRPIKPSHERKLKDLFYSQSQKTTTLRYGAPLKTLGERRFQEMCCLDYHDTMAIAGFVREKGRERMIAVGRYRREPGRKTAELAVTVHDDFQGRGIGAFLVDYLSWIARERGVEAFSSDVKVFDERMTGTLRAGYASVEERSLGAAGTRLTVLLRDWKGSGNPAREKAEISYPVGDAL